MTTKHTPGPWNLTLNEQEYRTYNKYGDEELVKYHIVNVGIHYIAELDASEPQAVENAKLIAAAPELLEALQKAEAFISGFEDDDTQENINELLAEIRNSITKAKSNALLEAQVPLSDKEIKSYLSFYTGVLLGFISKHGLNEILKKEQGEVLVNNIFSLVYEGKINT